MSMTVLGARVCPELASFERPDARIEALRDASRSLQKSPGLWFFVIAYSAAVVTTLQVVVRLLRPVMTVPWEIASTLSGFLIGLGWALGMAVPFRSRLRRELRQKLNVSGHVVCMRCGYDLRGQVERRCPECGAKD